MIRILHIVHALTQSGGLSNCIMNYYRNINRKEIQFDFIYFRDCEKSFINEITELGGKCYKFTEPSLNIRFYKEAVNFFKDHSGEYTAIHCHALFAACIYGRIAHQNGIKHVIAHAHSTIYGEGIFKKIRNYIIIKRTRRIADEFVACSNEAGCFMFGNNAVKSGKVKVIKNAIDCEKYKFSIEKRLKERKEFCTDTDNDFVIGHVGGFGPVKNHKYIIDVFEQVLRECPESRLVLIGGEGIAAGSTKAEIKKKVKNLGIDNRVSFLGVRSDVAELLFSMDAFIFPSVFEGLPIALIEAQTSGLRCYASDVITKEADIGLCNFLSIKEKPEKWANIILREKEEFKHNRSQWFSVANNCGFNIKNETNKLIALYKSLD